MTPKRRSSDRVLTGSRIVIVGGICTALLAIFAFAGKLNNYYKENQIKPLIESMINESVGPMKADVRVLYLYQKAMVKRDSIAKEEWNDAVKTVNKLFPEYAVE